MENKKENIQFRIIYFIGIILVVANHAGNGGVSIFYDWFPAYSFHLALFVFCSGYFFVNNKDKNIIEFIKKIIKKFLVPLYLWNLFYGIIITLFHHFGIKFGMELNLKTLFLLPIYDGHQFSLNLASWFIFPLFALEFVNIFILKILSKKNINFYLYFILTILLGFLGVQLAINGYNKGLYLFLVRFLYLLPFFSLGMLYKTNLETKDNSSNILYFGILLVITLIIIYFFGGTKKYIPSLSNDYDNFYSPFIVGILGIAFWFRVSRILVPSLKNSKIVMKISRNTYAIMMHHLTGFFILNTIYYALSNIFTFIKGFNYKNYKTDIFYRFLPRELNQFNILYVIFGIAFSLLIVFIMDKIKLSIKKYKQKRECVIS